MERALNNSSRVLRAICAAGAVCVLLAGCSKPPEAAKNAPAKKPSASAPAAAAAPTNQIGRPTQFVSVFATNNARDPFHPKAKKKTAEGGAAAAVVAATQEDDLSRAVQKGFTAIWNFGNERALMLFGIPFPENVEQTVPVNIGGGVKQVKIKPIKIYPTRADLQVEGVSHIVTVKRQ